MIQRSKLVRYYSEEQVGQIIHYAKFAPEFLDSEMQEMKPLSLRPEVAAFAQAMEEDLQWPQVGGDVNKLFERFRFWAHSLTLEADPEHPEITLDRAVAVAKYAMRIADVMGGLKGE